MVLNTAAQVALLLARYRAVGADPDVEFTATFRGRTISWSDFFYPPDRIGELRARLAAGTLDHPAVVLTDGHSRTDRASTPPQWHSFIPRGVRENMLFIRPEDEARTRMAQEIDQAPADGWWILFGQWFLAKPASEDHDARLTIAKVTIQQIIELDRKSSAAARRRWPLPPPARRHYRRRP